MLRSGRVVWLGALACLAGASVAAQTAPGPTAPPIALFFEAASPDAKVAERALAALARVWRDTYTPLLVDLARFLPRARRDADADVISLDVEAGAAAKFGQAGSTLSTPAARARVRLVRFLERQTGQRFGDDLGRWRGWMWRLPYEPHPEVAAFKRELYGRIDPGMRAFSRPESPRRSGSTRSTGVASALTGFRLSYTRVSSPRRRRHI